MLRLTGGDRHGSTTLLLTCTENSLYLAKCSGLACQTADINLPGGVFLCPRDSNPGWGDWSRSFRGWGVSCVVSCCLGKLMSVFLLVTRLGLMPCSAWSKKKTGFEAGVGFIKRSCREVVRVSLKPIAASHFRLFF